MWDDYKCLTPNVGNYFHSILVDGVCLEGGKFMSVSVTNLCHCANICWLEKTAGMDSCNNNKK